MIITNDRLEEIALAPREAMIAKAEAADLVAAYKSQMGAVTELDQDQYNNLVRDAMQWRARFTAPDTVPRSRLDAVEVELATAEQTLKQVQKYGHAEITRLETENKALKASAESEPLVTVHKDGVQFGKWCWFSHETITGCVAEKIPTKHKQYYEWFLQNLREQDRS